MSRQEEKETRKSILRTRESKTVGNYENLPLYLISVGENEFPKSIVNVALSVTCPGAFSFPPVLKNEYITYSGNLSKRRKRQIGRKERILKAPFALK